MRFASHLTLAVALAMGGGAMVASAPAFAAKKEKEAPKLSPSDGFRPSAAEIQKLITDKDFAGAKAKIAENGAKATTPDDKFFLGNFNVAVGQGLSDQALQRTGLELMLNSGKASPENVAQFSYFLGQFALQDKQPDKAIPYFQAAAAGNYGGSGPEALIAQAYFDKAYDNVQGNQFSPTGKQFAQQGLPHLKRAIEIEEASGKAPSTDWYTRGFKMAALSSSPDLGAWTKLALQKDGSSETWRIALRTLQDNNTSMSREENLDILRLMMATNALDSDYSYGEYIDAAQKGGLIGEVKTVIDAGRAKGKLPTSRYADYYAAATAEIPKDKASLPASETAANKAATGKVAAATASAYLAYGENAKAAALYRLALTKGGVDANEVNTRLGIALARSGDAAGAQAAFGAVSASAPLRKQIADLWTLSLTKPAATPAA